MYDRDDVNDDIKVGEWNMRNVAGIALHMNSDKLKLSIFLLSYSVIVEAIICFLRLLVKSLINLIIQKNVM